MVTAQTYTAALAKHNILVKAKNFLVFQGDVEHIASQNSKDLSRLVEQISGSLELANDYERTKKAVEKASESATESFNKKRSFAGEIKVFKEQMTEADRFEELLGKKVRLCAFSVLVPILIFLFRTISSSRGSYGSSSTLKSR